MRARRNQWSAGNLYNIGALFSKGKNNIIFLSTLCGGRATSGSARTDSAGVLWVRGITGECCAAARHPKQFISVPSDAPRPQDTRGADSGAHGSRSTATGGGSKYYMVFSFKKKARLYSGATLANGRSKSPIRILHAPDFVSEGIFS